MKKGITPVIAIILLLLITISMVGFAFVWFSRVAQTATESTEKQLQTELNKQNKKIAVDNLQLVSGQAAGSVAIRNIGSVNIAGSEIQLYAGGTLQNNACSSITTLAPNAVGSCTLPVSSGCTADSGIIVKVTTPGNQDQVTCGTGSGAAPSGGGGGGGGAGPAPPPP